MSAGDILGRLFLLQIIVVIFYNNPMYIAYTIGACIAINALLSAIRFLLENASALKYDVTDDEVEQYMRDNGFK